MSISEYCCFIWGKRKDCSHKIALIQKRAARIILNKPARTPSKPLFKELKWLTFPDRCIYHSALLVYKTLNDNAPSYMTAIIYTANNVTYHLRSQSHKDLSLSTRPKTKYMTDTFSYYSLNIWNNIPPLQIRKRTNENHLKKAYKEYLFQLFFET